MLTTQLWLIKEEFPIDYVLGAALGGPLVIIGIALCSCNGACSVTPSGTSSSAARDVMRHSAPLGSRQFPARSTRSLRSYFPSERSSSLHSRTTGGRRWTRGRNFSLTHVRDVLNNPRTTGAIETSVPASLLALAIAAHRLPLGACSGPRVRLGKGWRSLIDVLATIPLAMPTAIFGFALLYAYTNPPFHLYGTTTVIIVAYVTLMIPHAMRPLLTSMVALGSEYTEASRAAGAGPIRTALQITLPLLRSGISVAAVITLSLLFHEFSASMMVRSARVQVMGTLLFDYWTSGVYGQVAVTALLMCVVTTVVVAIAMALGGRRALERL